MKETINKPSLWLVLFLMVLLALNWYVGVPKSEIIISKLEENMTKSESLVLINEGKFSKSYDLDEGYFKKKREVTYNKIKGDMIFTFKRDTISDTGWSYYYKEY